MRAALFLLTLLSLVLGSAAGAAAPIRVASKPFTESYILSEMVAQIVEDVGETGALRKFGLGGPNLVIDALKSGDIDVDVNYTGSLAHLFIKDSPNSSIEAIAAALLPHGITLGRSLGFNNTYAIAVRADTARQLHLEQISDLREHPELRSAFTPDFLNYDDGFYKLEQLYGVRLRSIKPMQHSLAYQALASHELDLTDAYTTDGTLSQFDLKLLKDDRDFFPKYYGVITIRTEVTLRYPRTWAALRALEGKFSDEQMTRLNALVDSRRATVSEAARDFLRQNGLLSQPPKSGGALLRTSGLDDGLLVSTYEHFLLVVSALLLSCLVGIPLGILAFHRPRLGHLVIALTGLLQTIPSLALLCFLIPFLGIGALPTICALFIYGLLPIVQCTTSGLLSLDGRLIETAKILGLTRLQRLRLIELPLASISILSGIKTTAVINVATATIAALIGAGGYGRYITQGLAMNNNAMILKGAIPTALMAVAFAAWFELLGRWVVPKGLRQ